MPVPNTEMDAALETALGAALDALPAPTRAAAVVQLSWIRQHARNTLTSAAPESPWHAAGAVARAVTGALGAAGIDPTPAAPADEDTLLVDVADYPDIAAARARGLL